MARRGRPKLNRPKFDEGTPELQTKRKLLVPRDQTQSSCPLDALKARRIISDDAYAAASHFLACRAIMFGNPHPQAVNPLQGQSHPESERSDGDRAKIETRYRAACSAMQRRGRSVLDAVENVVVHERWPEWFFSHARSKARDRCMEGFAALLSWHKAA